MTEEDKWEERNGKLVNGCISLVVFIFVVPYMVYLVFVGLGYSPQ